MRRFCVAALVGLVGCARGEQEKPAQPAAAPVTGDGVERPRGPPPTVRVLVGGDVIPHHGRLDDPERLRLALGPLEPLFSKGDVVIANYETSTGDASKFAPHSLSLAASAEWMAELFRVHVDAITVANNHACDLGARGLDRTLGAARAIGLQPLGADESDPWAPKVLWDREGRTLCAVAWTTLVNVTGGCARSPKLAVAREGQAGEAQVAAAIRRSKKACTATLAIAHGGAEYEPQTNAMTSMARAAAEAGAVAVLMHHPHVVTAVRALETKDGRRVPFFPSLGNLVSNQGESWKPAFPATQQNRRIVYLNGWTRLGLVADLKIVLSDVPQVWYGQRLVWTDNSHADDKQDPHPRIAARLFDRSADDAISAKLSRDARGPTAVLEDSCNLHGIDAEPYCQ